MRKGDKGKKVFGVIAILAIIVSVFGGVVSAEDVSEDFTGSAADAKIQAAFAEDKIQSLSSQTEIFVGQGFDKCEIPTLNQMQNWITNSPYGAVNLYIGGSCRSCPNSALTASYVSQLSQQGWKFIPTWVGPQSPCAYYKKNDHCYSLCPSHKISYDSQTAYQQGVDEANAAVETAYQLGLTLSDKTGTIIYYDLEGYDTLCSQCTSQQMSTNREAMKSFINGWVAQLHARGNLAGVYGSSSSSHISDFASISNVPDAIWPAHWIYSSYNSGATVWDVLSLSNSLWANHQRIRQYAGGHGETWGSVTLIIDCNVIDGIVASVGDKFNIGDTVRVTTNLNVRTGPGTGYSEITDPDYPGYAPAGTIGTVLSGPSSADSFIWWEIDYGPGLYSGWSVEGGLEKVEDNILPTVDAFSVTPASVTLGDTFTIPYTVSDTGGSGLKQVELWRKGTGDWEQIGDHISLLGEGDGPYSNSFYDAPTSVGTYEYGMHVADNAGNLGLEPDPPGPIEVEVTPVNQQPTLTNGYVTPASGDTSTTFDYYVTYTDSDGDAPTTKYVYVDGSPHTMTKISGDYTSGATFKYSTTLSAGSHNYYFYFNDGHGHTVRLPTSGTYSGPSVSPPNQAPTLSSGSVTPASGDTSTTFDYYVTYTDSDGDAPTTKYVYVDGSPHTMTKISGDYTSGATFKYSTTLSAGSHNYYFYFNDGHGHTVRLPTSGTYSGPSVSPPNQAPTLSSGSVTPASGDTSTTFDYYVTYTDSDGDAPTTKYVYVDGSPHTMTKISGDYTSGATFKYSTTLSAGSHNYYFYFDDGHGHTVRLPTSGTYSGPTVCGNMGVNPTSWSPPTLNCGESDSQIVTVSATGGTVEGVTVSKISGETWLTLSQTNLGDIPSGSSKTFTMTAFPPAGTSSDDYPYTIRVSNTCGTPSSRDVTGTIHVACYGNMNVNPTIWSPTIFCGNTDTKTVTVSATGGTVEGVTVSKSSGPTWLSVSPANLGDIASGSSKTFTMTAAPPTETSGDFTYTVRVSNTCGTPSSRDVSGTITVYCPELSYSPTSHDFGDMCEGVTDSTTFEIWNSGTGTLTYTLSESCGWEDVNPAGGSSTGEHDTITVDIDTTGLSEGPHTCDISISSNGGSETFTVTVNVVPCEEPVLSYLPTSHDFGDICEGVTDSTTFEIWNSGTGTLTYTLSESCGWEDVNPAGGSSTGEHDTITVDIDTTGLSEGPHTCDISISSNGGSETFTVTVNVVPCEEPVLSYLPTSHDFGDICEGVTDSTTFEIWNSRTGTLAYTLSESCGWVDVNPASGSSTGEHDTITVDIDTTGLSEGLHTCDISIGSNGGSGTFTVTVNVVPCPETVVSTEDASAPQGGTVTVPIKIADVENMCGANIWLNYNKDVVIVDSVSDGDLVPLTHSIDNTAGVTKVTWDTTSGMTGDFVFAYVTLKAVGNPGDTSLLDLDVKELYNCDLVEIPRTVVDGTFEVIQQLMEGDVTDLNVCVSLKDSTFIKFYLVDMATLTPDQLECADTNDDGEVTLKDSTAIKFWLVVPDFPLWQSPADDHMMEPVPCSAASLARAASTTDSIEDASVPAKCSLIFVADTEPPIEKKKACSCYHQKEMMGGQEKLGGNMK